MTSCWRNRSELSNLLNLNSIYMLFISAQFNIETWWRVVATHQISGNPSLEIQFEWLKHFGTTNCNVVFDIIEVTAFHRSCVRMIAPRDVS